MKINELEKRLDVPRSLVFYYEKEGLLTPKRGANRYREYDEQDVERLSRIIALRKLGFSLVQITEVLEGRRALTDALDENLVQLQRQIDALNGAVNVCKKLRAERVTVEQFDGEVCLRDIRRQENAGSGFFDLLQDLTDAADEMLSFLGRNAVGGGLALPEQGRKKRRALGLYWLGILIVMALHLGYAAFPIAAAQPWELAKIAVFYLFLGLVGSAVLVLSERFILRRFCPWNAEAVVSVLLCVLLMAAFVTGVLVL